MKSHPALQPPASSKPILAIDFDDTVVFNAQVAIDAYNREHHANVTLDDVHVDANYGDPIHGWVHDYDDVKKFIKHYLLSEPGLTNPPAPGTVEALRRLGQHYDLVIVTGRDETWRAGTQVWLARFAPGLFSKIYFKQGDTKADRCHQIKAAYMIDDNLNDLKVCTSKSVRGVLFGNYPWNQVETLPAGVRRAADWSEVEELLDGKAG